MKTKGKFIWIIAAIILVVGGVFVYMNCIAKPTELDIAEFNSVITQYETHITDEDSGAKDIDFAHLEQKDMDEINARLGNDSVMLEEINEKLKKINVTSYKYAYLKNVVFENYIVNFEVHLMIDDAKGIVFEFSSVYSRSTNVIDRYEKVLATHGINFAYTDPNAGSIWSSLLPILGTVVIAIIFLVIMFQTQGGTKGAMSFAKTNARLNKDLKVRFNDVAGAEEEKAELAEVVDFLKNPKKFSDLGARIPKGVLLVGPPGTGKTLFAKAVAGESGVPFFSISGSDFVEMFVGVGASRVRDLFDTAKKNMPCIVFIDEIDAVGRQRGTGMGGGHDEREQTLNQLLVQMDGFESNDGIIVMAATNRADVLDPALLRPGRFDRQIYVNVPDVRGREAILKVHARNKPLASDVNFKSVARMTSGFSGADLENLLNEASILAARANRKYITNKDLYEGINKVLIGPQKKSRLVTETDKRITAYHEAGHAILARLLPNCDPVHEVSIIPRGQAAGYTMTRPENDDDHLTKAKLLDDIVMTLGGRVAEEIIIKDISAGASGDIQAVSKRARLMVTEWGMSEKVGPISYGSDKEFFIGRDMQSHVTYSDTTASIIDEEVKNIITSSLEKARKLLKENKHLLDTMARVLVERETIFSEEVEMIMKGKSAEEVIAFMDDNEESLSENPFDRKNSVIIKEEKNDKEPITDTVLGDKEENELPIRAEKEEESKEETPVLQKKTREKKSTKTNKESQDNQDNN